MAVFRSDFERGVNFTMSNAGLWQDADTDRMVQRAKYLNFSHVFFTFALGLNPSSASNGVGVNGWEVGVGPVNTGGSMPNGSFTYGRLDLTPSDQLVRSIIQKCNAAGLKVRLRPWLFPSQWRGNIFPSATGKTADQAFTMWMTSLTNAMVHYATICQQEGADGFSLGSEYVRQSSNLSGSSWPPNATDGFPGADSLWRDLITAVRVALPVPALLSYGANEFSGSGRPFEWTLVKFWDHSALDYIGIDFYGSMAKLNERRSDGQYLRASDVTGRLLFGVPQDLFGVTNKTAYITQLKAVSDAYGGKPIIFEEYGFASARATGGTVGDAISQPIFETSVGNTDFDIQYQATKGFLDAIKSQSWIKGAYVWEMNRLHVGNITTNGTGNYASQSSNGLHDTIGKPVEELFRVYNDPASVFPPAPLARSAPRFRE